MKGRTMKEKNTKKTLKAVAAAVGVATVLLVPTGCTVTASPGTGGGTGGGGILGGLGL